jgi:hypothetical protein
VTKVLCAFAALLLLSGCGLPGTVPASAPHVFSAEPSKPAPAKKKTRKEKRAEKQAANPDCERVQWALRTFSRERISELERMASKEQKRRAKACL